MKRITPPYPARHLPRRPRRWPFAASRPPAEVPIIARTLRVGGSRLHYLSAGEAGPPLVLVHGFSSSSRWWRHNIGPLARQHRVYALDLVGFGRSWPKHRFTLDRAMEAVLLWMDAVGLERADLCGHSMGGFLCMRLAAAYPELVRRLVLVDAAGLPFDAPLATLMRRAYRSSRHTGLRFVPTSVTTTLQAGPLVLLQAARDLLGRDARDLLSQIRTPTLVIWGEEDALIPLSLGLSLHMGIAHSRLAVIPGAGHNVMYEQPEAFNLLVLDFLT